MCSQESRRAGSPRKQAPELSGQALVGPPGALGDRDLARETRPARLKWSSAEGTGKLEFVLKLIGCAPRARAPGESVTPRGRARLLAPCSRGRGGRVVGSGCQATRHPAKLM